jgi:hypothetical protein
VLKDRKIMKVLKNIHQKQQKIGKIYHFSQIEEVKGKKI